MSFNSPLHLKPCCVNLRHKMMYCDPRQERPGLVDDNSDTRIYLCLLTQEVLGPDGQYVSPADCGSDGRACFKGIPGAVAVTVKGEPADAAS